MKKYDFLIFILFALVITIMSFSNVSANLPLSGKAIYLDPGHGGVDPGSVVDNVLEKDINLNISKYLSMELQNYGAVVYLTRDGDYDLGSPKARYRKKSDFDNRIKRINQSKASLYLSIHLNVLKNEKYYGPQVFYNTQNDLNIKLAEHIQLYLNQSLENDREIERIPTHTYMYSKLDIPGVLIEGGFLSNDKERALLITEQYQKKIASLIAEAISNFDF